jgi:hypothetical protein
MIHPTKYPKGNPERDEEYNGTCEPKADFGPGGSNLHDWDGSWLESAGLWSRELDVLKFWEGLERCTIFLGLIPSLFLVVKVGAEILLSIWSVVC